MDKIESFDVKHGDYIVAPNPDRENYIFEGWMTRPDGYGEQFIPEANPITSDLELFGAYRYTPPGGPPIEPPINPPINPPVDPPGTLPSGELPETGFIPDTLHYHLLLLSGIVILSVFKTDE